MINALIKNKTNGSITVFLSLILLLILALIFTIIEGARVSTAKVYAERALSTAMDSVLAEYYGPLWEEYHIFGLYPEGDGDINRKEEIGSKLSEYMSYTFEPEKDLKYSGSIWELYDIKMNQISVERETVLTDYQGKLLINEAVEYMKYKEMGNAVELLLNKLSLLETPEKVSYVYEEKEKVEEELVLIDQSILELMELLDGLKTGKNGIQKSNKGELLTAEYFAKKICFSVITKETVGINQESIFLALKDHYINPDAYFMSMSDDFAGIDLASTQISTLKAKIASYESIVSSKQVKLKALLEKEKQTQADKLQIKQLKTSISMLQAEIKDGTNDVKSREDIKLSRATAIQTASKNLMGLISELNPIITHAIKVIGNIMIKTETVEPFISHYEELLNNSKGSLNDDVFAGLQEDLAMIKKYIVTDADGYNFQMMKNILENNYSILSETDEWIKQADKKLSENRYQEAKTAYERAEASMRNYQIEGLTLDYSSLTIEDKAMENPIDAVNNILQAGITGLVMDPQSISEEKLNENMLPSQLIDALQEQPDFIAQLKDFFIKAATGSSDSMKNLFGSFGEEASIQKLATGGVNKLAELILYQEYLKEHFTSFPIESEKCSQKPSALTYEQEYLLVGNCSDQENLYSVITKILFKRTIFDFISLLGQSTKRNEARAAATLVVGFTGLPILVAITQAMIMLAWSFAEALLDVCALMKGKEVPIIKKEIILELPELFLINRSFLEAKVMNMVNPKELSLSYQDYLRIFLLMKSKTELAYRSMDLIQENIKIRYALDTFQITDCIFGFQASLTYTVPPKFTGVSFVHKLLGSENEKFMFTTNTLYSY